MYEYAVADSKYIKQKLTSEVRNRQTHNHDWRFLENTKIQIHFSGYQSDDFFKSYVATGKPTIQLQ